ncbi:MAG: hypothetical protein J1E34_01305 [Oscillospiraceae bacterium]|nr:hypothetical protein [Oscillospiraceae bacterium]
MRKRFKKFLGTLIAAVMVLSSLPLSVFAADAGSTLTIYTNVTASGIEIDENVSFDYLVAIGGLLYDGTAEGDDGNTYQIKEGKLSLPYNVKAVISGLGDGVDYNVQRLTYDNPKYALVNESEHITGEIASREYYKTVNGERGQIDAEIFNRETNNGAVLYREYYLGQDGAEYETANEGNFVTYNISRAAVVNTPDGYEVKTSKYLYADIAEYSFKISGINTGKYSKTTIFGKTTCTVTGSPSATASSDYSDAISSNKTQTVTAVGVAESSAQRQLLEGLQLAEAVATDDYLAQVLADSGKTAVLAGSVLSSVYGDTSELGTKMYVINELTEQKVSYEAVSVESNKVAEFNVTLEKAPTGTVSVDFMLDNTIPEGYDGAVFEIRNANGDLMIDGVDYNLEIKPVSIKILSSEIGFTRYIFSGLLSGNYTLQQIEGAPSYAVDTAKYAFTVERDGNISGENVASANSVVGDPSSVIYNSTKKYVVTKVNFFANASFSLEFITLDQNEEPVEKAQFFMVERDEVIKLISSVASSGVASVTNTDWGALLSSLTSGEGFTFDLETLVKLLVEVASNGNLTNLNLPAILMEKSGEDGITTFNNASNILNALDILSSLGDVKLSDLANLIKTLVGDNLSGDLAKYIDMLAEFDMTISVHAGVPTGAYLFFESSAPKGYKRNSSLFTVDVASDGSAEVYSGVLLPLIADYIDGRLGYDIYNILVSEEEFNNAAENVKNMFGTFENYKNTVINGVLDFVDATLGDRLDLGTLEKIRDSITGYYDKYDDLSAAVGSALRDFNKSLVDTFNGEWVLTNERIFVDVIITVADCLNKNIEGAVVTVTNVDDPDDKYTALKDDGNAYLHYGTYTVEVTQIDEKYILFTDTDEEGSALYSNPFTLVINDDNNGEQNVSFYYHEDGGWQEMDKATCTTEGFNMRSCKVCEMVFEEEYTPATGHNYVKTTVPATCTSDGYIESVCENCGDIRIEYSEELTKTGHKYDLIENVPADHENAGYEKYECANCNESYTVVLPATGHDDLVESDKKDPTCTENGYIEYICSDADCTYTERVTLPALGHTPVNDPAVSPTCKEEGKTAGSHCDRCQAVLVAQEKIDKKEHTYELTIVAPTCTEKGTITKVCSECQDTIVMTEPERGHNFKYTYIDPTCEESGKIISECLRCTYSETKDDPEKPKLNHDYKERTIKATCEHDGVTFKTCTRCNNKVEIERVPQLDHELVIDERIEPTCTEVGYTQGAHCRLCMKINGVPGADYQHEIPAKGHSAVVDEKVAPTCTENGLTSGSHCETCGEVLVEQIVIAALGHETGNWKIVSLPSAEADGLMTKTCTRCGEVVEEKVLRYLEFHSECGCKDCNHEEGNYFCVCKFPIKVQKVFFKVYKVLYKIFSFLIDLPHMCSIFGVI